MNFQVFAGFGVVFFLNVGQDVWLKFAVRFGCGISSSKSCILQKAVAVTAQSLLSA